MIPARPGDRRIPMLPTWVSHGVNERIGAGAENPRKSLMFRKGLPHVAGENAALSRQTYPKTYPRKGADTALRGLRHAV